MNHQVILAAVPTVIILAALVAILWWDSAHPHIGQPTPPAQARWEYGPELAPLTRAERAELNARGAAQRDQWREPRPGALIITQDGELVGAERYQLPPAAPLACVCPVCEARDDEPHGPGCWLGDGDDLADNCMTIALHTELPPRMLLRLSAEREGNEAVWLAERRAALRGALRAVWDTLASS